MSAPNFNRIEPYRLDLVLGEVDRTTWWKDENRREPANVWWLTGPGVSRPATDIEISLWNHAHWAALADEVEREIERRQKGK